ncbi:MAG: cytochrome c [Phycisphaerales bacterium]
MAAFVGFIVLTVAGYRAPWSPDFGVQPLPAALVDAAQASVPAPRRATVARGADLVHAKGCLYCHDIDGHGGHRGPELSPIGELLTRDQLVIRITNGGHNMPAFASALTSEELDAIVAFLQTRRGDRSEGDRPLPGAALSAPPPTASPPNPGR